MVGKSYGQLKRYFFTYTLTGGPARVLIALSSLPCEEGRPREAGQGKDRTDYNTTTKTREAAEPLGSRARDSALCVQEGTALHMRDGRTRAIVSSYRQAAAMHYYSGERSGQSVRGVSNASTRVQFSI